MHDKWVWLVLMAALAAGCARVQDPWVNDAQQWRAERERSAEQERQLQHRLAHTQTDR